jgi:hypothetical protein
LLLLLVLPLVLPLMLPRGLSLLVPPLVLLHLVLPYLMKPLVRQFRLSPPQKRGMQPPGRDCQQEEALRSLE